MLYAAQGEEMMQLRVNGTSLVNITVNATRLDSPHESMATFDGVITWSWPEKHIENQSTDVKLYLHMDRSRWVYDNYWWLEGNGSCDCNRRIQLAGEEPDWDTITCGSEIIINKITTKAGGRILYPEGGLVDE